MMQTTDRRTRLFWIGLPLMVGLLLPSLVLFAVQVVVGGVAWSAALADVLARQFAPGHNLFLIAVLGLLPFVVLAVVSVIAARRLPARRLSCFMAGGLAAILAITVPGQVGVWAPFYGGGQISSTAPIAFVILPVFGVVALAVGLLGGWLISCLPVFRAGNTGD